MQRPPRIAPALLVFAGLALLFALPGCPARRQTTPASADPTRGESVVTESAALTLPGARPFDPALEARMRAALKSKGPKYEARTHHKSKDGAPKFINRLIFETSPYLLQHAHNPVNWHAWGDDAFLLAKRLERPILLSIGYSTCHWCHVMEGESFEDEEIAAYINAHYVAIKVDREERPDVDSVYMKAVQLLTGRGGWPMTTMLTHDRIPFFGGTYFPPRDGARGARVGFLTILRKMHTSFTQEPGKILEQAERISAAMQQAAAPTPSTGAASTKTLIEAARFLSGRFDPVWGGFGRAPKFPRPSTYELLLRYWRRTGDPKALSIVTHSLDRMCNGGIYDHIGGGFHRYSTDTEWLTPHFEKMLYDNAQLVTLLIDTHQATGEQRWATVARDVLDYVAREMTSPEGGFYSATDADSEGHEGLFFVWTPAQLGKVLGDREANVVRAFYGVTDNGNFEGKNILNRPRPLEDVAAGLKLSPKAVLAVVAGARKKLYEARKKRIPPLLDDKIIAEWNGQMISAFARAGLALGDAGYVEHAKRAADFVLKRMRPEGRLLRTFREGSPRHTAALADYAFFTAALLDVFEATHDARWLDAAITLQAELQIHYQHKDVGGFFATPSDGEALVIREKPTYDGAQPSGNSVAVMNLLRLSELTSRDAYRQAAERALKALGSALERGASGSPKLAQAVDFAFDKPKQIIVLAPPDKDPKPLLDVIRKAYLPNRILVVTAPGEASAALAKKIPLVKGKKARKGLPTAYVCTARVCLRPTSDPAELATQLAKVEPLADSVPKL